MRPNSSPLPPGPERGGSGRSGAQAYSFVNVSRRLLIRRLGRRFSSQVSVSLWPIALIHDVQATRAGLGRRDSIRVASKCGRRAAATGRCRKVLATRRLEARARRTSGAGMFEEGTWRRAAEGACSTRPRHQGLCDRFRPGSVRAFVGEPTGCKTMGHVSKRARFTCRHRVRRIASAHLNLPVRDADFGRQQPQVLLGKGTVRTGLRFENAPEGLHCISWGSWARWRFRG